MHLEIFPAGTVALGPDTLSDSATCIRLSAQAQCSGTREAPTSTRQVDRRICHSQSVQTIALSVPTSWIVLIVSTYCGKPHRELRCPQQIRA